jgi:hypothetical protein
MSTEGATVHDSKSEGAASSIRFPWGLANPVSHPRSFNLTCVPSKRKQNKHRTWDAALMVIAVTCRIGAAATFVIQLL